MSEAIMLDVKDAEISIRKRRYETHCNECTAPFGETGIMVDKIVFEGPNWMITANEHTKINIGGYDVNINDLVIKYKKMYFNEVK